MMHPPAELPDPALLHSPTLLQCHTVQVQGYTREEPQLGVMLSLGFVHTDHESAKQTTKQRVTLITVWLHAIIACNHDGHFGTSSSRDEALVQHIDLQHHLQVTAKLSRPPKFPGLRP